MPEIILNESVREDQSIGRKDVDPIVDQFHPRLPAPPKDKGMAAREDKRSAA
jgi:hypothetical protein